MQRTKTLAFACSAVMIFSSVLAGCGVSSPIDEPVGAPVNPGPGVKIGTIKGTTLGGGIPIVGAKIFLFAASQAGYGITTAGAAGSKSVSLLTPNAKATSTLTLDSTTTDITYGDYYTTTDSTGTFALSGDYTCTAGQHLYLLSLGGYTVSGNTTNYNSAAGEMAVLPDCPATGLSFIYMNEVSTIAAAYAFAGFAYDAVHVGTGGGVGTLADTGIKNAFLNASNIYDISNQAAGNTGGSSALASSGNVTRNQALVDTLANILQYCINSVDAGTTFPAGISAHCTNLFSSTGADNTGQTIGKPGTTATGETATAAIFIAHNPSRNIANMIPGMVNTSPAPFSPALSVAPNDLSIQLKFTGGGLGSQPTAAPHDVAVDAGGNIWVTSISTNTLSEFNTLGVPAGTTGFVAGATGFSGNGMAAPQSVAIDTTGNVWVGNYGATSTTYTLSKFSSVGSAVGKYNAGGLNSVQDAEFDSAGDIWLAAVNGAGKVYGLFKLTPAGTAISKRNPYPSADYFPYSLAPTGSAGFTYAGDLQAAEVDYADNGNTSITEINMNNGTVGVAVDSTNRCWVTETQTDLAVTNVAGTNRTQINLYSNTPVYYTPLLDGVALDGEGTVWVGDYDNGTIYSVSSAGAVPPTFGYPAIGNTVSSSATSVVSNQPDGIAVDGSGNVWYRTLNDNTLREIVGIAAPVVTPLAYGVAHNTQGTRP